MSSLPGPLPPAERPAVPGAPPGPPVPPVSRARAALALALLMGLQPITTDLYLPALPALTRELAAPVASAQLTMAALILAFGIAQMVWGPVADRVGRRPVLLAGLLLYCAASAGCTLAGSMAALIVWRALQGAALAAAVVCARAIVRDLYEPHEGARVMSLALSGLGVIALAAPLVGGFTALWAGWRATLALVGTAGFAILCFIAWRLPETLRQRNPQATRLAVLLPTWWRIARHPVFVAWALLVACTYGGLFVLLAGSSFVYIDVFGLSPAAYGTAMATGSLFYLCGTFLCRRWIAEHGVVGTVARGVWFTAGAGVAMAATLATGAQSVWAVLLPHWLFAFAHGIHQPCGQAGMVAPFPHAAGAAAALAGLLLALVAFAISRWLGVALDGSVRPLALALMFWAAMTCAVVWLLVRRLAAVTAAAGARALPLP